ncbi:DUF6516 family protein [Ottowia sp.]|jgi:hypothetical protein|uniref:toxin-antitoxin system TumE family protein n=1 Tax=Ottowia sp. TaxID=1898956 RepID=UPI0025FBA145|nr:DUF6516 family protein [Ottowia sp.]MBK6615263.1 hypothetical protein [Ottowia sp.]
MRKAHQLIRSREVLSENSFVKRVVWLLPAPLKGSVHTLKYRLAYVVEGTCVVRYDNEASKGDHRHVGADEHPYAFTTPEQLLADFWQDVQNWKVNHEHCDHRSG